MALWWRRRGRLGDVLWFGWFFFLFSDCCLVGAEEGGTFNWVGGDGRGGWYGSLEIPLLLRQTGRTTGSVFFASTGVLGSPFAGNGRSAGRRVAPRSCFGDGTQAAGSQYTTLGLACAKCSRTGDGAVVDSAVRDLGKAECLGGALGRERGPPGSLAGPLAGALGGVLPAGALAGLTVPVPERHDGLKLRPGWSSSPVHRTTTQRRAIGGAPQPMPTRTHAHARHRWLCWHAVTPPRR